MDYIETVSSELSIFQPLCLSLSLTRKEISKPIL